MNAAMTSQFDLKCSVGSHVVTVCRHPASLADAGRKLFAVTREKRSVVNDSDRLRKYLARFGLDWSALRADAD